MNTMLLVIAATDSELKGIRRRYDGREDISYLITGVGPVETSMHLTRFLSDTRLQYSKILSVGVAGAYVGSGPGILDFCVAEREVFGDFGICQGTAIDDFDLLSFETPTQFDLRGLLLQQSEEIFSSSDLQYHKGTFVTVNSTSGTLDRGMFLKGKYHAICENMEGAAAARVCQEFDIPFLEFRVISNMVEDRDISMWRLSEAIERIDHGASILIDGLTVL